MRILPQSLFGRTAMLIGGTLLLFSIIAWQAIIWTAIVPAAELGVQVLTARARTALAARETGRAPPADTRFESSPPSSWARHVVGFAFSTYIETICRELQAVLDSPEVHINRIAAPSEIWLKVRDEPNTWLVLSWRLAGPKAPLAALAVLGAAGLIVLGGAAISARRLTAPLAALAAAAARVAEGEKVDIATEAGPREVRSLAAAFQSMSRRLAELDEQRELMLGGISHDLRTPLARIRVAVELLEHQDSALLEEMAANIEEMDRMVGQFLHYVRANYRETPTQASLDEVARQTLALYASDGRLRLALAAGEPRMFAVECARHTLLNLVQNAIEYGQAPVTLRTAVASDAVMFSVEDRGGGLGHDEWLDAVRPFHRLRSLPSKGHTGLGLALVDRLIRTCGGSLRCEQIDDGFVVQVSLPAPMNEPHDQFVAAQAC